MKSIVSICLSLLFSGFANAASVEEDVNRYAQAVDVDNYLHPDAVESLGWAGISDPRLFDSIERRVLEHAQNSNNEDKEIDAVDHYIEALGFSGQSKYAETLNKLLSDRRYQRHAKAALENLPLYGKWNPIISNRATFDPKNSDDVNRVLNMLHSNDFLLKRVGAKCVYFRNKDDVLLDALASEIRANYSSMDSSQIDSIAWMEKALGSAKQEKNRPVFDEVIANGKNLKVVDYAKKALALK